MDPLQPSYAVSQGGFDFQSQRPETSRRRLTSVEQSAARLPPDVFLSLQSSSTRTKEYAVLHVVQQVVRHLLTSPIFLLVFFPVVGIAIWVWDIQWTTKVEKAWMNGKVDETTHSLNIMASIAAYFAGGMCILVGLGQLYAMLGAWLGRG